MDIFPEKEETVGSFDSRHLVQSLWKKCFCGGRLQSRISVPPGFGRRVGSGSGVEGRREALLDDLAKNNTIATNIYHRDFH